MLEPKIRILFAAALAALPLAARAEPARDGQHDFDFHIGTWRLHVKKLKAPLHGSKEWVELDGTSVVRPLWGGKAHVEEIELDAPGGGHLEGMTVRTYSPTSHQWTATWGSQQVGRFDTPAVGELEGDHGAFYDQEPFEGRTILVRLLWSNITRTSAHVEQAFSADGGKTWEVNWIAQQTRVP
jgi:hypothetical protein